MIRFVTLNVFIGLYSIPVCLWGLTLSLFTGDSRKVHFYAAVPWARGILKACGIKVHVSGLENVDPATPRIYMSNHQSYFDILGLLAVIPVDFKFIMKQELMKIPLLGPTMRAAGYIGIAREDPRKAVASLNEAVKRIRAGASVMILPEGTRSPDGRLQEFKKGGFTLALKAGCDIVPVTIQGSHRIVPKGSLNIRKGEFAIHIGKPIPIGQYSRRNIAQLMQRVRQGIQGPLDAHKEEGRP